MKRAANLFEKILSTSNLEQAIDKVNKTHRWTRSGDPNFWSVWVECNKESRLHELGDIIENGFEPLPAREFEHYDTNARKWRTIYEPRQWPDQYVHHALIQVLMPICMRGMDPFCCGSVPGRGIHYGVRAIKKWIKHDPKGTRHCAVMDIFHFYQETPQWAVLDRWRHLIKDYQTMDLIERTTSMGIKVGFYPSAWHENTLLQPLDRFIREHDCVSHYLRYMDNFTIFGPNKRKLHSLIFEISDWLADIGLKIKDDWQVFPSDDRLPDALGYRYATNYTLPRKFNLLKVKRETADYRHRRDTGQSIPPILAHSLLSRYGQLHHCNNVHIYATLFQGEKIQRELKQVVRTEQKEHPKPDWDSIIKSKLQKAG